MLTSQKNDLLVANVMTYGITVFDGQSEAFFAWLRTPNVTMGGKVPQDLMGTSLGLSEVKSALTRIEFGNYG